MSKTDQKGRTKTAERHLRLTHTMTGSPAWKALTASAIKLLVALQRLDNGENNGDLFLSVRKAQDEIGLSRNTVAAAFKDLEDKGFVVPVVLGSFKVRGGPATSWRLTFVPAPSKRLAPTHDWQRWQPNGNKTRFQNLTSAVAISDIDVGNSEFAVPKIATGTTETSHVSISTPVAIIATQVVCHRQGATDVETTVRKQAISTASVSSKMIGNDQLADLRGRMRGHLRRSPVGEQGRLAVMCSIPGGTLSKFISGRGLSCAHALSLQLVLGR